MGVKSATGAHITTKQGQPRLANETGIAHDVATFHVDFCTIADCLRSPAQPRLSRRRSGKRQGDHHSFIRRYPGNTEETNRVSLGSSGLPIARSLPESRSYKHRVTGSSPRAPAARG